MKIVRDFIIAGSRSSKNRFFFMKTCDFCGKRVIFLQNLDHCSVCDDCFIDLDTEKDDLLDSLPKSENEN